MRQGYFSIPWVFKLERDQEKHFREILKHVIFPVGGFTKPAIREMSRQAGIQTANKPDSQEICFIPDNDYASFITRYRGEQDTAGELVDTAGKVLGKVGARATTGYLNRVLLIRLGRYSARLLRPVAKE